MVRVGSTAPIFACSAVVEGSVVELTWKQVHENKVLVLLFDSIESGSDLLHDLVTFDNGTHHLERVQAKVAVVCRDDSYDILAWLNRSPNDGGPGRFPCPIFVDSDDRIASMYDMLFSDGRTLWGQCIIDPFGIIRQLSRSAIPVGSTIDELIRCVEAVVKPEAYKQC